MPATDGPIVQIQLEIIKKFKAVGMPRIILSVFTPAAWMKTNNSEIGGRLRQDMYDEFAEFYILENVMKFRYIFVFITLFSLTFISCQKPAQIKPSSFKIELQDNRWVLLKNGSPYYIKGAVARDYFDKIKRYGGNSVRIWYDYEDGLNKAHENGLTVMVSLPVKPERNGMDWNDTLMVKDNIEEVMTVVKKFKDHPAVMLWALGNELDWIPPGIPYNPKLWNWINLMAAEIKKVDTNHPVMTVVGNSTFEQKTIEIAKQCPNLDLIGINLYGDFSAFTEILREHLGKPYVVSEWGPEGHWQRPYTTWKAPIEQSSSEKALSYRYNYKEVIQKDQSHCLGSYVFLWGQKQEITHTWYGMFSKDGLECESVDVMHEVWTGEPPANTAPRVKELLVDGQPRKLNLALEIGNSYTATLQAEDSEDELSYHWEIKEEVEPASYAGIGEIPAVPIQGLISDTTKATIQFTPPKEEGAYRLFSYAFDGQGNWAYANVPFYCR